jgi:Arc/MetJ-type ribon-helix-helix transcriptional regulator
MVFGMATKKLTITLDEGVLSRVRELVASGKASSVSGFVQHAVGVALDDEAGWAAMLADALEQSGGAITPEERAWADQLMGTDSKTPPAA